MEKRKGVDLESLPPVLTPAQLAAATGRSAAVIRRQCADGTIPAKKIGSEWAIGRDNVLGPLVPQPIVADRCALELLMKVVGEMIADGKTITIELKGAEIA